MPKQNGSVTNKAIKVKTVFASSVANKDQWNEVRFTRKTPISKQTNRDNERHWTNSFYLLARADGNFNQEG
jgi:hypothetical protein